jgi:drug/metabolite transporter (DMT)-like permease
LRGTYLTGLSAGILGALIYAGLLIVGRHGATATGLTVYDLAGLRMGVAALCTLPLLVYFRPSGLTVWRIGVVSMGGAPFAVALFAGLTFAPVANAAIVVNGTLPILTALLSWAWIGERPTRGQWLGIALVFAGVAATSGDAIAFGGPDQWRASLLFLGAAASAAIFFTAIRAWRLSMIELMAGLVIGNAVVYVPLWLLFLPSGLSTASWPDIALQSLYQGVLAAFIAGLCQAHASRIIGATRQAAIMAGAPAVALFLAIPLLGELPGIVAAIGVGVVTGGILMTVYGGARERQR